MEMTPTTDLEEDKIEEFEVFSVKKRVKYF